MEVTINLPFRLVAGDYFHGESFSEQFLSEGRYAKQLEVINREESFKVNYVICALDKHGPYLSVLCKAGH